MRIAPLLPEHRFAVLGEDGKAGFRVIGIRERIGRHYEARRDVMLLERRSPTIT
ncbi:hypothetical protein ACIA98_38815 [Streptomyces sp. NPDC051366]|uniref:hypothetical protein n=1 Tax=Streptomyces sp. NPDC051366 TaxID=3365652 RepID=UPI00379E97EB